MNNLEFDILNVISLRQSYSSEQIKHLYDFAIELSLVNAMDLNTITSAGNKLREFGDTES